MGFWDILILLAIAGCAVSGFLRTRKRKASGKGCCGDCSLCGLSCSSGRENEPRDKDPRKA